MYRLSVSRFPPLSAVLTLPGCLEAPGLINSRDSGPPLAVSDSGVPDGRALGEAPLAPRVVEVHSDPCEGLGTPTLYADADTRLLVGCDNGRGLWHTTERGTGFQRAHPSEALTVFDLKRTRDGAFLVCGHDDHAGDVLLYAGEPGGDWTPLLRHGRRDDDPSAADLTRCGAVAEAGPDVLVVASLTARDITRSSDGGSTWSAVHRPGKDDDRGPDGNGAWGWSQLVSAGEQIYSADGQIADSPAFSAPATHHEADGWTLHHGVVDPSVAGAVWALATSDGGATWFAGGREQTASGGASGFLYRSTDGGETWAALPLPEGTEIVRDVAFDESGRFGVAVGHRHPLTEGGVALVTADGGARWAPLDLDTPLLESVAVAGGTFWLAGDAYLARGAF